MQSPNGSRGVFLLALVKHLTQAKLLQKLNAYGIRNVKFEWFSDYLFKRKQLVNHNKTFSEFGLLTCGVPLGSILDNLLYVAGNNIGKIESQLSNDLNLLAEWFKENKIILNLRKGKTEAMIFGTTKRLAMVNRGFKVKYQHHTVNVTTKTFNDYFMTSYKKATGCLHVLIYLRHQLDTKAAVTIYKSLITPVLTYCSVLSILDIRSKQTVSYL